MATSHAGLSQTTPPPVTLSSDERNRYQRHFTLPGVGVEGQRLLKAARVLIVGAGGLGSPTALYLAAAGVGTLGLVDNDVVDASNLQRQILHGTRDIGRPKLESAKARLHDINPHVEVILHAAWLTSANALDIIREYDIVMDGTDNFATRYLVNDACVMLGKPNVHGSVFRFDGQASIFATEYGPCYRCLYPEPPPAGLVQNCAEGGVFGVLPGLVGMIQATETLKLILGTGETLTGRLLMIDALTMEFRSVSIDRDPECPACGTRTITELIDYDQFCGTPALSAAPSAALQEITPSMLVERLARSDDFDLIDVREPHEALESSIAGSRLIPLGSLAAAVGSLDPSRSVVVVCRSGKRSADGARLLMQAGFADVATLAGGMLRWSDEVPQLKHD